MAVLSTRDRIRIDIMLIGWSPALQTSLQLLRPVATDKLSLELQSEDKEPHHRNNKKSKFSITSYSYSMPSCELCSLV
ncbi:Uncharacterized protein APZ42_029218 [Daphnia magna]|uniref:Uncharacterized protein n=1 Tax=Daphnia magna TaxID=35525 RepID=A0A164PUA4_9CRUS|nr:Uncharacterized protein APZ42_029218 [Daphnia magna]